MFKFKKWQKEFRTYAREEIVAHLPYTLIGVALGLVLALIGSRFPLRFGEEEFHMAHFVHIFFSAAAGSAIFSSYKDKLFKAIPVVLLGSVLLCTLSDSLIPFWCFKLFGVGVSVHVCAVEHPFFVTGFATAGFLLGRLGIHFFKHCNRPFHLLHILISTVASVLYIVAFVPSLSPADVLAILFALFFSLAVPCLVGDVALPLCFVNIREEFLHEKVHHSH